MHRLAKLLAPLALIAAVIAESLTHTAHRLADCDRTAPTYPTMLAAGTWLADTALIVAGFVIAVQLIAAH